MSEGTEQQFVGGFAPMVRADGDLTLREAGSLAIIAGGNAEITEGGAGICVVGGNLSIHEGGTGNLIVGGNAELNQAAVGQMAAIEASVTDGRVGVLLAGKANLERSEVMVTTQQAVGFGVAAGVVFFLLSKLFGRG